MYTTSTQNLLDKIPLPDDLQTSSSATPALADRRFDLVVFGASGYTGGMTCEQVLAHSPSTLKWAIAGRSPQKLELLASDYNREYPDRVPVSIFVAELEEYSLERLARSTRCLITTVGPFIKYGMPVVEACAMNGTHYIDSTGEHYWVKEVIARYHKTAKATGAIIIPQCGFESAPADLASFLLVKTIREAYDAPTTNVKFCLYEFKGGMSGGTLETSMAAFEHNSLQELNHASRPYALSPVKQTHYPSTSPISLDPDLGVLTSWVQAIPDRAIVMRSWGLNEAGEYYGKNFCFKEYKRVSNVFYAVLMVFLVNLLIFIPLFPPVRWVARKLLPVGYGPAIEARRKAYVEWRATAEADDDEEVPRKALVTISYKGDPYTLTGALLVQAALIVLHNQDTMAKKLGGGVLTPAAIATPEFFRELERAGFSIESRAI